ncbi:sulfoxide reductase heme-binding subunit YedZ [Methylomonas koyamae]|uniref:Protein-methionine-sulfoxide reductase heme-binding subunit MsrQ n=1 Tax=Methylomonas koyamae TaxID=702114 RepID=A0A177N5T3_9GAMM|nr:protein-methionine-sulfoxide reductase heme-binding subunit MsrQ [Methylomonas koyamae]OAI12490.1 sulfoxide reductase heme-binding subunit YedZ [Methylomonas koyamae]
MPKPSLNAKALAWIKVATFLLALLPLAKLGVNAYLDDLGANPIEKITHVTGYWTLTMLTITLAATPLRRLSGWNWPIRLRRMLGLFAFGYGCLHLSTYLVLDQFFDWDAIVEDIVKRPYITVGFAVFVAMVPLAITSTDNMLRRLGGKNWLRLHRLAYLCAVGGVVHYWWLVKKDLSNPIAFASVLAVLLGVRIAYRLGGALVRRPAASRST